MTNYLHDEMACWRKHLKDCRLEDEIEKHSKTNILPMD